MTDLFAQTADALALLLEEGTIRYVGVSNFCAGQLAKFLSLTRERGFEVVANQVRVNNQDQGATEYLIPYCNRLGVKVIAYSPLAQGLLVGDGGGEKPLSWVLSQGVAYAVPATNNKDHLRYNLELNYPAT